MTWLPSEVKPPYTPVTGAVSLSGLSVETTRTSLGSFAMNGNSDFEHCPYVMKVVKVLFA